MSAHYCLQVCTHPITSIVLCVYVCWCTSLGHIDSQDTTEIDEVNVNLHSMKISDFMTVSISPYCRKTLSHDSEHLDNISPEIQPNAEILCKLTSISPTRHLDERVYTQGHILPCVCFTQSISARILINIYSNVWFQFPRDTCTQIIIKMVVALLMSLGENLVCNRQPDKLGKIILCILSSPCMLYNCKHSSMVYFWSWCYM